jgi:hypothetical protein
MLSSSSRLQVLCALEHNLCSAGRTEALRCMLLRYQFRFSLCRFCVRTDTHRASFSHMHVCGNVSIYALRAEWVPSAMHAVTILIRDQPHPFSCLCVCAIGKDNVLIQMRAASPPEQRARMPVQL